MIVRRAEDGVVLMLVEVGLLLIYICVLLIKTCNESEAVCSMYGLGESPRGKTSELAASWLSVMPLVNIAVMLHDRPISNPLTIIEVLIRSLVHTADVYIFFLYFGLSMICLQLLIGLVNLWTEGRLPKILLIARAHAISPRTLIKRVAIREARHLKRWLIHRFGLDQPRLTPRAAAAVYRFRLARGGQLLMQPEAPKVLKPVTTGDVVELSIDEIPEARGHMPHPKSTKLLPSTACFVQMDLEAFVLRWSQKHFVSLHTLERIELISIQRRKSARRFSVRSGRFSGSGRAILMRFSLSGQAKEPMTPSHPVEPATPFKDPPGPSQSDAAQAPGSRETSDRLSHGSQKDGPGGCSTRSSRASKGQGGSPNVQANSASKAFISLRITYNDVGGIMRWLELRMRKNQAERWCEGLRAFHKMVPAIASPTHYRWALSCMAATSERGATGFLLRGELLALVVRANGSIRLSLDALDEAIRSVEETEQLLERPQWLKPSPVREQDPNKMMFGTRLITGVLTKLCTSSDEITTLFDSNSNQQQFGIAEWLAFVGEEQLPKRNSQGKSDFVGGPECDEEELLMAQQQFDDISTAKLRGDKQIDHLQFALLLLAPQNDAVTKAHVWGAEPNGLKLQPLSHYWTSCSHNTCTAVALEFTLPALCTSHRVTFDSHRYRRGRRPADWPQLGRHVPTSAVTGSAAC